MRWLLLGIPRFVLQELIEAAIGWMVSALLCL
jgi:hypothetical protein